MTAARGLRAAAAALLLALAAALPASAQYFGRNKVQYRTFAFEVMRTAHFDIYFYPEERGSAGRAALMAERWHARLSAVFSHQPSGRQPLVLYASHPEFEQTNIIEGELGEGIGGVTERFKRRIVLPLGASLAETDHIIGHELVHAFQFDIATLGSRRLTEGDLPIDSLPLWFIEGLAEYLSIGSVDPLTAMWMRDAAIGGRLPSIHDLRKPKFFPYRWGQALWAYIGGRYGDDVVASVFRAAALGGDAEAALRAVLGIDPAALSKDWHQALRENAEAVRRRTRPLAEYGQAVGRDRSDLSTYNISPSLSPDGRRMMFLSQRDLLSIDLFLADAATGRVVRKVVNMAVDAHFSSLEMIGSAGAWSPDSRRFALAAVHAGVPQVVVFGADSGSVEQEVPYPGMGEIFSPSWSPDGRAIVFSALHGGVSDLFVVDLASRTTRQLTDDAYADLQPAWSPDGRRIAFVTDRFTTDLERCAPGQAALALLDLETGAIQGIDGAEKGRNINPQWSGEADVVFVSDRSGVSNIYRVSIPSGRVTQVTDLAGGVSGITAMSPAISYAAAAGRLAFSAYDGGKFSIFSIADRQALEGSEPAAPMTPSPAQLPPARREQTLVADLRRNAEVGLADALEPTTSRYRTRLTLDEIGQPYITAGVGSNGAFAGGGTAFAWSDMLGDYWLGAAVEVNGSFIDSWSDFGRSIGGQIAFINRKHRWNYGLQVGQSPWIAGSLALGLVENGGRTVGEQRLTVYRQVERAASGIAYYPFNAADRFEVSAGYSNISFDQRVDTTLFDPNTGAVLSDSWTTIPGPGTLSVGKFSAAFVHDTATFGATSPVRGDSVRLQVSQTVGTIHTTDVLADFRRYVMPVPFYTVAGRVLHYGRYGHDAQDSRLLPMFLGSPTLVRGYDVYSFGGSSCTVTPSGSCAELDRLLGSRILVGNLELRFPLLRPFGVKPGMYSAMPTELAVFADAGVAWNAGEKPSFFGGERQAVSSAGVAVRTRLFGILILELDLAVPFQHGGRGPVFQLNLAPGF